MTTGVITTHSGREAGALGILSERNSRERIPLCGE